MMPSFLNWFRVPSAETMALRELAETRRLLLDMQSRREYANAMCDYYTIKARRLIVYLRQSPPNDK